MTTKCMIDRLSEIQELAQREDVEDYAAGVKRVVDEVKKWMGEMQTSSLTWHKFSEEKPAEIDTYLCRLLIPMSDGTYKEDTVIGIWCGFDNRSWGLPCESGIVVYWMGIQEAPEIKL